MNESSCWDCKDWNKCTHSGEWFAFYEIRFCKFQMIFGIEHLEILEAGEWPPSPDGSSYIDPQVHVQARGNAHFETPAMMAGEIRCRLNKTGEDGQDLIHLVKEGVELTRRARLALAYISGWRRKEIKYTDWKSKNRHLGKRSL